VSGLREEWGPWVEHDGKGCPVSGMYVEAEWQGFVGAGLQIWRGVVTPYWEPPFDWRNHLQLDENGDLIGRVLRYRVRIPPALIAIRQMVEDLPERVDA
jgi:hypothetical protein